MRYAAFHYFRGVWFKIPIESNQVDFMINEKKMKKWSSQWTQFMQLRKEAWKNSGVQFAVVCLFFEIHPRRKESKYML